MTNALSARRRPNLTRAANALFVAAMAAGCAGLPQFLKENDDKILAVDVALQPDKTLVDRTRAPESHITLVRRFVRASDLHSLSAAVANVMATTRLDQLNLRATGYRSGTWDGVSGTAMVVDLSPDLLRLEERIVEATRMFAVNPEPAESFIVTPDGTRMTDAAIDRVLAFVPEASGPNFRPHVMTTSMQGGSLESQPFEAFTFKPYSALVYQLGQHGAPQRLLWTWTGEFGARRP